ncbi:MAG: hypothetical protein ACYTEX_08780 [Planctomycetota bacterium]|jgi:hypothetical protein
MSKGLQLAEPAEIADRPKGVFLDFTQDLWYNELNLLAVGGCDE